MRRKSQEIFRKKGGINDGGDAIYMWVYENIYIFCESSLSCDFSQSSCHSG